MRFGGRKGDKKLYKQWEKYAGLSGEVIPQEAIPQKEAPTGKNGRHLNLLYILLGVSMLIFFTGLALLLIKSC